MVPISQVCRQVTTRRQSKSTQATSTAASEDGGQGLSAATASWIDGYTTQQLSDLQRQDPVLLPVHEWINACCPPTRDEAARLGAATRSYWINYDNLERIESVLYLPWADPNKTYPTQKRLLVPQSLRHKVLACFHDGLFAGHLGVQKTVDGDKRRLHWPGLGRDVKIHIRNCKTCRANKMPYKKFLAALSKFRVREPMDHLGIDFMGPLQQTKQGNKYLLVIVDYFTRWAEAFALLDQQAETLAATFVRGLSVFMVLRWKSTVTRAGILRVLCFKRFVGFSGSARHGLHHTIQARTDSWKDLIAHLPLSSVATWKCVWLTEMSTFRILPARIRPPCILQLSHVWSRNFGSRRSSFSHTKGRSKSVGSWVCCVHARTVSGVLQSGARVFAGCGR